MPGMSDYLVVAVLNFETGQQAMPALASRYLALFTTAPTSDGGSGGTEVSGGSYARLQVAGALAAGAAWTTSSTSITLAAAIPSWVVTGMNVYDATNSQQVGTVSSVSGATLTLTAAAAHASSGSADSLIFSTWHASSASSGSGPATSPANVTNGATIAYPQATANWGSVVAFGIYDALSGGNLIAWDYLGNYKWNPFTCTSASPGVLTSPVHGYSNSDSVVVTAKFGGTLPATAGSWSGILTVAAAAADIFNVGVNTTGTGDGQVRKILQQSVSSGVAVSFAPNALTLTLA
jgi:hypothetical protein